MSTPGAAPVTCPICHGQRGDVWFFDGRAGPQGGRRTGWREFVACCAGAGVLSPERAALFTDPTTAPKALHAAITARHGRQAAFDFDEKGESS